MTIRCSYENCNKKLKLIHFKCKCNMIFCMKHKMPEIHNCSFDYRAIDNLCQKIENTRCIADKIKSI